jgi:hypothetical protein
MGFGCAITFGKSLIPLPEKLQGWLVEARVEMELSAPTRYALRFEDDICDGRHEVADDLTFEKDTDLGLFVPIEGGGYECLVLGPITKVRSSSVLGGPGSWVEFHGEDRRARMGRITVQSKHKGKASAVASKIIDAYEFKADVQDTLIEHDEQKLPLTQSATDLAFIEDVARRNNMDFWLEYKVVPKLPALDVEITGCLKTSPERKQSLGAPVPVPTLTPDDALELRVAPPGDICANITKFDTRINYERPASARGFTMSADQQKKVVEQLVEPPAPLDADKIIPVEGIKRELAPVTKPTPEEAFLAQEAIVFEQSWFVEADCSASFEQLGFVVRPHQIVKVSHAGEALSGAYQVMKATHVINAADYLVDFLVRASGLGGRS